MGTKIYLVLIALFALLVLAGCSQTSATINARNEVMGVRSPESNFLEAKQIAAVENWKDTPGKIVMVYLINQVTGGLLVPPIQCMGVPNSSTESLEPNTGYTTGSGEWLWLVPVDGADVYTDEMAGKDGTHGEPVAFRYCMGVDGNYYDWPALGLPYLVSSASYTFPDATVVRDFEAEAKLLIAEGILKRGGCINTETLEEISCKK